MKRKLAASLFKGLGLLEITWTNRIFYYIGNGEYSFMKNRAIYISKKEAILEKNLQILNSYSKDINFYWNNEKI